MVYVIRIENGRSAVTGAPLTYVHRVAAPGEVSVPGEVEPVGAWPCRAEAERKAGDLAAEFRHSTYIVAKLSVDGTATDVVPAAPPETEIDPYQIIDGVPLELEDGTPVEVVEHWPAYVRARALEKPAGPYPPSRLHAWGHDRDGGGCAWGARYMHIRRAGFLPPMTEAEFSARARKRDAAREVALLPSTHRVPWETADWSAADHYARLDIDGDTPMVAFYASEKHLMADRLTKMRVGRYLTRYYKGALTADQVERLAAEVSVKAGSAGLTITQDADEIEQVYCCGPSSCMSDDEWESGIHPARVYAGPDLAVAYTGTPDDPSGRAVVWPEKKVYYSIYGDCSRMEMLLEQAGYRQSSAAMHGARGRLIWWDEGESIVMPYVDFCGSAEIDEDAGVVIFGHGDVETQDTVGWVTPYSMRYCDRCDERHRVGDAIEVDGDYVCSSCAEDATWCDLGEYYTFGEAVEVNQVGRAHTLTCAVSDLDERDVVFITAGSEEGEYWMAESAFTCDECGETFHERDAHPAVGNCCRECGDEFLASNPDAMPFTPEQAEAAGQIPLPLAA